MKLIINMLCNEFRQFVYKNKFLVVISLLLIVTGFVAMPKIFAELQPVRSVEIFSEKLDYNSKEPGAWKVTKSAKWTDKSEAEITFDVDTVLKMSDNDNKYTDVLLVLDISESMFGDKIKRVKADSAELIESILSNNKNKVGLITFDSISSIVSDFTTDKEELISKVNGITVKGATNYYQALINVDKVLKNYIKEKDRNCVVLFLTDGFPCEETPNEIGQYSYLKTQYPFATINGIQYEMGSTIMDSIANISDRQYFADMKTLSNVLFEAAISPVLYEKFEISDYIDTNYFNLESEKDIAVSHGNVILDKSSQKVTWILNEIHSGLNPKMTIKITLKDDIILQERNYSTNKKTEIKSEIEDSIENISITKTPVLSGQYNVTYDVNLPDGSQLKEGIAPDEKQYSPFDVVEISDMNLVADTYRFKGWEIVNKDVKKINDDYFLMPEENVVFRAVWSKLDLTKTMNGEVQEYIPPMLEKYTDSSTYGLHKYKDSITEIIFQNSISSINGAKEVLDISEQDTNEILAYVVPNSADTAKYTVYIQGEGKIVANTDSSYLFDNFTNLKSIQNLGYFDTSKVTNMNHMFSYCSSLTSLDLSNFDTTNVTNMGQMFYDCSGLTSLSLSGFNTSNVTFMKSMFLGCSGLTSLNLNSFNTAQVQDMSFMFQNCTGLTSLNLNNFDTSNVNTMLQMFYSCSGLTSLNILGNFNTSNVTTMKSMFYGCSSLASIDMSNFATQSVTDMSHMFRGCSGLTSLDFSKFDTTNVIDMNCMFYECIGLTQLDFSSKFNTKKVTDMRWMFYNCSGLTSINHYFNTSSVTSMKSMFCGCSNLSNLSLQSFFTSNVEDMSYMFKDCAKLGYVNGFRFEDVTNFDTSNVKDMSYMFSGADVNNFGSNSGRYGWDFTRFDTSNVTNMKGMFHSAVNIDNHDFSNWDTSKVTNMSYMFYNSSGRSILHTFEKWNTSNVIDMSYMFYGANIGGSNAYYQSILFNTSKVTNMRYMFGKCINLVTLDFSSWNTSNVTDMRGMFYGCNNMTKLDLSNFNTSKVTDMGYMFSGCKKLADLNISNFNTSKVTDMAYMFYNCVKTINTTITIANKLTKYDSMFTNAASLSTTYKITVNYTSVTSSVIDTYIATKSSNSNVVKGRLVSV